jgi:hypothetical protein
MEARRKGKEIRKPALITLAFQFWMEEGGEGQDRINVVLIPQLQA